LEPVGTPLQLFKLALILQRTYLNLEGEEVGAEKAYKLILLV